MLIDGFGLDDFVMRFCGCCIRCFVMCFGYGFFSDGVVRHCDLCVGFGVVSGICKI